jgi:hypothetical protein
MSPHTNCRPYLALATFPHAKKYMVSRTKRTGSWRFQRYIPTLPGRSVARSMRTTNQTAGPPPKPVPVFPGMSL